MQIWPHKKPRNCLRLQIWADFKSLWTNPVSEPKTSAAPPTSEPESRSNIELRIVRVPKL